MEPTGPGSHPSRPPPEGPCGPPGPAAAGRSPSSGPPALAAASSCASARSSSSRQAFRGLIAAVVAVASPRLRPPGAPGRRPLASRAKPEGRRETPQEVLAGARWGAGNPPRGQSQAGWGPGPRAPGCASEPRGTALLAGPPPGPPPRAPRLARLKLGGLT